MAQILEMPKLSDTMTEGSIIKWLKKEGDKIESGLPLVEVETDKSNMEYESPYRGVLLKIIVGDGQKCDLQAPIAVIGKADENWEDALQKFNDSKGTKSVKKESAPKKEESAEEKEVVSEEKTKKAEGEPKQAESEAQQSEPVKEENKESQQSTEVSSVKASPLAKKMAADMGIDLTQVKGSGPNSRIVQRDLKEYTAKIDTAPGKTLTAREEIKKVPLTNMRKIIAKRLIESVSTAPHFYLKMSINMTQLLQSRKAILAQCGPENKFSVNDLIIYFVSRALVKHPEINASWKDDCIEEYSHVHMSVAVALPSGGLITPVVRHAHALSIFEISREASRLIALARDSKLKPEEYSGGTFSISNLGMTGVEDFTAIINPPQAAILAIGSTIPTPCVSQEGNVVVEQRMTLSLSCDHRVIDGLMGAQFLQTLKHYLENPLALLLNQ